jgi:hypothetical protein
MKWLLALVFMGATAYASGPNLTMDPLKVTTVKVDKRTKVVKIIDSNEGVVCYGIEGRANGMQCMFRKQN